MDNFFSLIQTLLVLIMVIFLANKLLKYLNNYMVGQNKLIKIIERVAVNKNSYISIAEICGKYYLMSFSENKNEILKELNEEEIKELILEKNEGEESKYYLEMRKKIEKKISNYRNSTNMSRNGDSRDDLR